MRVFVTGVGGQLGYDMMRELLRRGHEGVGSDLAPDCGGGFDYVRLDITDQGAVERAICETRPDAVVHCAGWTRRRIRRIVGWCTKSMWTAPGILRIPAKKWVAKCCTCLRTMCSMVREQSLGNRTARTISR